MARYIDLDKAIERLNASPAFGNMGTDGYFLLDVVKDLLNRLPTLNVAIVKHGRWFFTEYDYFDCSVCGGSYYNGCESSREAEHALMVESGLYKYCPHCGAKMDGGKKE